MIKVDRIIPNSLNPRRVFDEEGLQELSKSIKRQGLIQPIRVRTKGDKYEVVTGDRRCKAIKMLGMKEIPDDWVIIQGEKTDEIAILESLSENIQRGDLSYLEIAEGIKAYKKEWELNSGKKISQQKLADEFGKSQKWTSNHLKILELSTDVREKLYTLCINSFICENYIIPLKDTQKQLLFLMEIEKKNLSNTLIKKLYVEFKKTNLVTLLQTYEYLPETTYELLNEDSRSMGAIADNSIHLVITSPPYGDIKEYSTDERDIGNYKDKEYFDQIKPVYEECFRVLQPGRKFCLNIKNEPRSGESGVTWYPYSYKTLELCMDIGFEFADVIIWNKPNREGMQFGSLPYPGSPLISDSIEYIFILRKPGTPDYSHLTGLAKEASVLSKEDYSELIKQVWDFSGKIKIDSKGEIKFEHLAPFPEELPTRLIKLYSYLTEIVLDPFAGSGTTLITAKKLGRNTIGYEINKSYVLKNYALIVEKD